MKIFLLYETTDAPWGGINTFFRNFAKFAERDDTIQLVSSPRDADIVLTAGHYRAPGCTIKKFQLRNIAEGRSINSPFGFLGSRKKEHSPSLKLWRDKKNTKVVFRVDGLRFVYSGNKNKADGLLLENLEIADSIIFQSQFSQNCFDKAGIIYPAEMTIVLNGSDQSIFFPSKKPLNLTDSIKLVSNSWSKNENKGFAAIADFSDMKNVAIKHVGQWPANIPTKNVELLGTKTEFEIAEILRSSHFMLFPSVNEACSNAVIEALASGVPVLYHNTGGTPELCEGEKYGLPIPNEVEMYEKFIMHAKDKYCELRNNILNDINKFSFERCYKEYIEFFKNIL